MKFGVRPSTLVSGADNREAWDEWDVALAEGYQIMQSERCSQCGLPRWICHNEDAGVYFELKDDVCFAKREIDEEQERLNSDKNYKKPAGQVTIPRPVVYDDTVFDWRFRQQYYESERKLRAQIDAAHKAGA